MFATKLSFNFQRCRAIAQDQGQGQQKIRWSLPEVDVDLEATKGLVGVGRITVTHGVKGDVRVLPLTDDPVLRLGTPGKRWLVPKQGRMNQESQQMKQVEIQYGKETIFKGMPSWIVKLKGVNSREEAEEIRNWYLMISTTERESLSSPDEFYMQDLFGMQVKIKEIDGQEAERIIGRVVDVLTSTGTYDVLRIQLEQYPEKSALLPFQKSMVPSVDLQNKQMTIEPPEGWEDLYLKPKEKKVRKK